MAKKKPGRPRKAATATPARRKPGRPRKVESAKRRPGRPRKVAEDAAPKRRPGRPRKNADAPVAAPATRGRRKSKVDAAELLSALNRIAHALEVGAGIAVEVTGPPPPVAPPVVPMSEVASGGGRLKLRGKLKAVDIVPNGDDEDEDDDEGEGDDDNDEDDGSPAVSESPPDEGDQDVPLPFEVSADDSPVDEPLNTTEQSVEDEGQVEVPGIIRIGDEEVRIDPSFLSVWDEQQLVAVGLLLNRDFSAFTGQPRNMRVALMEAFVAEGIVANDPKSLATLDSRPRFPKPLMPVSLTKGPDSLPTTSPTIKVSDYNDEPAPHVERHLWRVRGKWKFLHLVAEEFREAVARTGKWECSGFNCHDCIEAYGNLDQLLECHEHFSARKRVPKGGQQFAFLFPPKSSDFATDDAADGIYALERDE